MDNTNKTTCQLHQRVECDIRDIKSQSREDHRLMWDDIKEKVSMTTFKWIIGLIIGFVLIIGGAQTKFAYDASNSITEQKVIMDNIQKDLKETRLDIRKYDNKYFNESD